ncbi:four-helix bundle copper-binding protein [Aequorivita echinoideorum]|uniref:Four-helix bundle copper-binding protein n=1 Tax=Aequorivita echinoideorum TaxID=1549647 RepID=A0ABS5S4F4_9FLAO|nr:four-helix bundle copper-binding protein [Aequorivita echinoideorum]MBT0608102.1 four-helix bundle copper-binding protein [Aequorivita echinoideorum]
MKKQNLIDALYNCIAACNTCASACLGEENVKMMADCIRTDIICAEICATTAKLVAMDSSFAKEMVALCQKACKECGDECAKHDHDHCKKCAEACRKCEDACKTYAA